LMIILKDMGYDRLSPNVCSCDPTQSLVF
jgi:hypothetical protein